MRRVVLVVLAALALAAPSTASEQRPTAAEVEARVMCPICEGQTLDQSNSAVAQRMKAFISGRIATGDTRSEIEAKLVAEFGPGILAEPRKSGFDLLAWLLPIVGILAAAAAVGALAWRWSRLRARDEAPAEEPRSELDPDLERRLDEELARFEA